MVSIRHKFVVGQVVFMGRKKVTIIEQKEFLGSPSYRVEWYNKDEDLIAAIMKEEELNEISG